MLAPLSNLAARLHAEFPEAQLEFAEPAIPGGVGFLDISEGGSTLVVQWDETWHFGISTPEGHGYGEKPDEMCGTVDAAATRIIQLLRSGASTQPPRVDENGATAVPGSAMHARSF